MRTRLVVPVAATALSAFGLFTLELHAGRIVLPIFGGSAAVWPAALSFFTTIVFLGYLYAHLLVTRLAWRVARYVHLGLVMAALGAAALAPRDLLALKLTALPPAVNVVVVLAAVLGVPTLLLATTTPLVSARVAARGNDPWWLYAASNAASFGGLLAYPLLIEPNLALSEQRVAAYVLLVVLGALLAAMLLSDKDDAPRQSAPPQRRPSRKRELVWLTAAFMPAGLLSAVSTQIATDHASAPWLWIGPLGVYLGSFVVAFTERGRRMVPYAERLVPTAATLLWVSYVARVDWPVFAVLPAVLLSYAVVAVAVHGRLAADRPSDAHLTRFYLWVSAGGGLATAFVALVAPVLFESVTEYPLLLVGSLAALALLTPPEPRGERIPGASLRAAAARLAPLAVTGVLMILALTPAPGPSALFVSVLLVLGAVAVMVSSSLRALTLSTATVIIVAVLLFAPHPAERVRSFFGVTDVVEAVGGQAYAEIHGTTLHGLQYRDERAGEPTAYFVREGPLGDVFAVLDRTQSTGADIGVTGLGIGTIAAYARPNDTLTYFEIDQAVVDLARDERYFTYLAHASTTPDIRLGDGRLLLAEWPPASLDLLVLDAFSSDSVPAHLLTREAMAVYARTLTSDGVLAFQLTNRHFDLVGAAGSTARAEGLDVRTKSFEPTGPGALTALPSTWLVAGSTESMERFDALGWERVPSGPVLTDDYPDVTRLLKDVWRPAVRPQIY